MKFLIWIKYLLGIFFNDPENQNKKKNNTISYENKKHNK